MYFGLRFQKENQLERQGLLAEAGSPLITSLYIQEAERRQEEEESYKTVKPGPSHGLPLARLYPIKTP